MAGINFTDEREYIKPLTFKNSVNCDCNAPNYRDKHGNHRCTKCNALNNSD